MLNLQAPQATQSVGVEIPQQKISIVFKKGKWIAQQSIQMYHCSSCVAATRTTATVANPTLDRACYRSATV